jgi:hypothetical protein
MLGDEEDVSTRGNGKKGGSNAQRQNCRTGDENQQHRPSSHEIAARADEG